MMMIMMMMTIMIMIMIVITRSQLDVIIYAKSFQLSVSAYSPLISIPTIPRLEIGAVYSFI